MHRDPISKHAGHHDVAWHQVLAAEHPSQGGLFPRGGDYSVMGGDYPVMGGDYPLKAGAHFLVAVVKFHYRILG
jgi:hypothetical protein